MNWDQPTNQARCTPTTDGKVMPDRQVTAHPDQVARVRAWWASIMQTVTAAGGMGEAIRLVEPKNDYSEDLLWMLLDLDWSRFPEAIRKDGTQFGPRERVRVESVMQYRSSRDKLSQWARDVELARSGCSPVEEPKPERRVIGHKELLGRLQGLKAALDNLPKQITVTTKAQKPTSAKPSPQPHGEERKRATIPRSVKQEVWVRDGGRCRNCGITDEEAMQRTGEHLHYDHIRPWSMNGADTPRNIQLLCGPCNRVKSSKYGA
jgi:5-methylcytosine-specific restriction endonuclease McrA